MRLAIQSEIRIALAGALVLVVAASPQRWYAQHPENAPQDANNAYRAGEVALAARDLSTAQSDFAKVVRLEPQQERGYSALGAVLASRGEMQAAIRQLQTALALQPDDRVVQLNLALALVQTGSAQEALPLFAQLEDRAKRRRQPLPASAATAYARALAQNHQIDDAEAELKAAIARDPRSPELRDGLGSLYAQQLNWADAQREFASAVTLKPDFARAHLRLGLAMRAQHQAHGLDQLIAAMQLAPGDPVIALNLGEAYADDGNDPQAISAFRRAIREDPSFIEAVYQLALALQRMNDAASAIPLFRKVVAAQPRNSAALTNLGLALCEIGHPRDAVPVVERAISADPSNVVARENLAVAYVQLSEFDDAVGELLAALKIAPDQSQLHYDLGVAYKWQDNVAAAIAETETAERLNPKAPDPPYLLGYLYMQEGHYPDAAREMRLALKLQANDTNGWATLGSVYENLNELPQAEAALREAIRQDPTQAGPHLTLASVLVKQNKLEQAREDRSKAAGLMRTVLNHKRAEVSTRAGEAKLRAGDIAGAASDFQNAIHYDPSFAEARLGFAKTLDRQGKTIEAAAEREKVEMRAQSSATRSSPRE